MCNHANSINLRSCLCEAAIQKCFQEAEAAINVLIGLI